MLKDIGGVIKPAAPLHSVSEFLKVKATLRVWLNHPNTVIGFTALVAFWGVWQLGYYLDDWFVIAALHYTYHSPFDLLSVGSSNRFPIWGVGIAVFLMQTPLWISHTIVIAAHASNAMLFRRLLDRTGFGHLPALAAALLFLVWPCHSEILFWLASGAAVWGALFVLVGLNLVIDRHFTFGTLVVFLGFLNSEGLILPGMLTLLVALWYKRSGWRRIAFYTVLIVGLYGLEQLWRSLVTQPEGLLPYKVGLTNIWTNIIHLGALQIAQTSSQDVNWLWRGLLYDQYTYTVLIADYNIVLVAGVVSALIGWWAFNRTSVVEVNSWKVSLTWAGFFIIGWFAALAIFTILTQQLMQNRYTYTMTFFFCAILTLLVCKAGQFIGRLFGGSGNAYIMGETFLKCVVIALLTWSIFLTWSAIYRNWLPAKMVSERIIADLEVTGAQTKVSQIYVVDSVAAVGNAFTISVPWSYEGVGQLFLGKDVLVTLGDAILGKYPNAATQTQKFTDKPCVFITWKANKRTVSYQMVEPFQKIIVDCHSGTIGPLTTPPTSDVIIIHHLFGIDALKELDIHP